MVRSARNVPAVLFTNDGRSVMGVMRLFLAIGRGSGPLGVFNLPSAFAIHGRSPENRFNSSYAVLFSMSSAVF